VQNGHLADGQPAEMGNDAAAGGMEAPVMPATAAPEDQGGEKMGWGATSATRPEAEQVKAGVQAEEAAVLAHGNAVCAELGIPPSPDIAVLSRNTREQKARYEAALRKLTGVQKELAALARPRRPNANVVQMRVKDLLRLNGPMSGAQIIEKLAGGGFPVNSVRSAIGILDWHQHIIAGRYGWELIDDDDELARRRHWRSPRQ